MQPNTHRRRRAPIPQGPGTVPQGWITLLGEGSGFHDCPLCRELASSSAATPATPATPAIPAIPATPAIVGIRPESLPMLVRTGWLDDLVELVGRNATVRVMGRDMEAEPVEVISMETFLARLGYE
jgi:hypothetical protein